MDALSPIPHAPFPAHGPIACRHCFADAAPQKELGPWRVVNDPGAWGSAHPEVLVLGSSKGFTQAALVRTGRFEDIPFARMRPRLTEVLQAVGVLGSGECVSARMTANERRLAFGPLVRCSLSRFDAASGRHACTGPIMAKAFSKAQAVSVVRRCTETYFLNLPANVRLVLMLGTGDAYVAGYRGVIRTLYGPRFAALNPVAYRTARRSGRTFAILRGSTATIRPGCAATRLTSRGASGGWRCRRSPQPALGRCRDRSSRKASTGTWRLALASWNQLSVWSLSKCLIAGDRHMYQEAP